MKKIFALLFLFIAFASCGSKKANVKTESTADSNQTTDDTNAAQIPHVKINTDSRAIDTVMSLPEIVDLAKEIEKNSKGKNHLSAISFYTPVDLETGYYAIQVGEDNGESVVGIYNFNVYVPEMKIMFNDPISGNELTLNEWRKQSK